MFPHTGVLAVRLQKDLTVNTPGVLPSQYDEVGDKTIIIDLQLSLAKNWTKVV